MENADPRRLNRDTWVEAAYRAFEDGGVAAVRVDPLAKALDITRGSFYWHFKTRADLLEAVLARWDAETTEATIAANEAAGGAPSARLLRLLETCAADDGRFEIGMRAWAAEDRGARAVVDRVDRRRTDYVTVLLTGCGLAAADARLRARVVYAAWIGLYTGAVTLPFGERLAAMRCLHRLVIPEGGTIPPIPPAASG